MGENVVLNRFSKTGDLRHLSRRFHNLSKDARRAAVEHIKQGMKPERAITHARIHHNKEAAQ